MPDASADVAQQIVKSRGVAYLFVVKLAHGHGDKRDENEADKKTAQDDGPEHREFADLSVHVTKPEGAGAYPGKSSGYQPAVVEALRQ